MLDIEANSSRRRFLWYGRCLAGLSGFPILRAAETTSTNPFDSLPLSVWERARVNGLVMVRRPVRAVLSHKSCIVRENEPGQRLVITGRVFAPDACTPVEGVTVYAYHTDAQGYYGENRGEYPPRIYGWMRTNALGCFELSTIRPGHYPDRQVPAHIHLTVWGEGYPLQWLEELRFSDDPLLTREIRERAVAMGAFCPIQPLIRAGDGVWHGRFQVKLQEQTNFV